ncbi:MULTISPECIES: hypothetical protein [unclassified Streptosporangium]|uniref:hypothetical protein n=1 Tax=unclassified Streptosporangium TaxID=2632669 RepID=UPI002E2E0FE1|nr:MULTISPECIES: hypothetical protein [unclassified Streptosporangium]
MDIPRDAATPRDGIAVASGRPGDDPPTVFAIGVFSGRSVRPPGKPAGDGIRRPGEWAAGLTRSGERR